MKTLKITLKQHTPLIHFQHTEFGATLRASEVKPKLDRFIIEKLGGGSYENVKGDVKKKYPLLFIPKDDVFALDYKLAIHPNGKPLPIKIRTAKKGNLELDKLETFPLVLSNMKKNLKESINFVQYETVDITLITRSDLLYLTLKDSVECFFASTNFGQRQNKGFGSFTVLYIQEPGKEKVCKEWTDKSANELMPHNTQYFSYKNVHDEKDKYSINKEVFEVIDYYWKLLKSGINYTKRYVKLNDDKRTVTIIRKKGETYKKAFLWKYLKDNGVTWEKRKIKEGLLENNGRNQFRILTSAKAEGDSEQKENNLPYFFARAHLGCPISGITYKVMLGKPRMNKSGELERDRNGNPIELSRNYDIAIESRINGKRNDDISRIPSPIIFKPIICKNIVKVYILFDNKVINALHEDKNTNRTFSFSIKKKENDCKIYLPIDIPLFCKKDKGSKDVYLINYQDLIEKFHEEYKTGLFPVNYKNEPILIKSCDNKVELHSTTKK